MHLGRVIGTVVATERYAGLGGVKFLVVQPLDSSLANRGEPLVAADAVHMAGPGELVYYVASREAALTLPEPFVPVDHAICGIADAVHPVAPAEEVEAVDEEEDGEEDEEGDGEEDEEGDGEMEDGA